MSKKVLSLLLAMVMLLSVIPMAGATGETEAPAFTTRSLTLNESIAINFKVPTADIASGFEKVEFLKNNEVVQTITEAPAGGSDGLSVFTFTELAPNELGTDITAKLYVSGQSSEVTTSVLDYCMAVLADADEDPLLKTAIVDLLNYGAASQTYNGLGEGETLVNANLGDYAALGTTAEPSLVSDTLLTPYDTTQEEWTRAGDVTWLSAGLNLTDSVTLRLKFQTSDTANLRIRIWGRDADWTLTNFVPVEGETDQYYVYFSGLNPAQLRDHLTIVAYYGGVIGSAKLYYSVESYAYTVKNDDVEEDTLQDLTTAMMRYGDSVYTWYKNISVGETPTYIELEDMRLSKRAEETFQYTSSVTTAIPQIQNEDNGVTSVYFAKTTTASGDLEDSADDYNSHISFTVTPEKTGEYSIWIKVKSAVADSGAYFYIEGGSDTYYWRQPFYQMPDDHCGTNATYKYAADETGYTWIRVYQEFKHTSYTSASKTKTYNWTAGETYTVRIRGSQAKVYLDQMCIIYGEDTVPTGAHKHTYETTLKYDDTQHWNECSCGATQNAATHTYSNGECECGKKLVYKTENGTVTIEAETATLHDTTAVEIRSPSAASGGQVVRFKSTNTASGGLKDQGTEASPHMSIAVTADVTGEHYIWIKVYNKNSSGGVYCYIEGGNDAYYWRQPLVKADGTYSATASTAEAITDYFWVKVSKEYIYTSTTDDEAKDHTYNWTAGETYTINFRSYYSAVQIDQILITTDSTYTPGT